MKTLKKLLLVATICLAVYSCKKDKETPADDSPFANETVDQGKANLESTGQQMVAEMQAMKDNEAVSVLESFDSRPFTFETTADASNTPVFRTLSQASKLGSDKNHTLNTLTALMKLDVQEDTTLTQLFNSNKGIYTWNNTTKDWDKTPSATEFKFLFPSKKDGIVNDATLTFTYTSTPGVYKFDDYEGDLPTSFNASIVVKGKTVFEIDFSASYASDGMPTAVNYFIALYPYKYEITWSYTASSVSLRYHLTNNTTTIFDIFGGVGGNFSKSNLETVTSSENGNPTDILYNGSAYFQVFNIQLNGAIDFKNLYPALNSIYDDPTDPYLADSAAAVQINKYASFNLIYADSKKIIATAEAYPYKDSYTYFNGYEYITEDDTYVDFKVIFKDGSKNSLEEYFSNGFGDLVVDLNKFIEELNTEYNLTIKPIDE